MSDKNDRATLGIASLVMAAYLLSPIPLNYATRTFIDHDGSSYSIQKNEDRVICEQNLGLHTFWLIDEDKNGEADEAVHFQWVPSRLLPFRVYKKSEPTEDQKELFERVLEQYRASE